ncbi:MAG: DUF1569 domain-containing protein [Flammeovirgaceae bacterium]
MKKRRLIIGLFILTTIAMLSGFSMFDEGSKNDKDALVKLLGNIEQHITHKDQLNTNVSKVDVAWHLDHMLKVIYKICHRLDSSDVNAYRRNINPLRTLVFTTGKLSRGKGKAPQQVLPPADVTQEAIHAQLGETATQLKKFESLHPNANFEHPYFGQLNKKQAMRFMRIHTEHHLAIIQDILKNKAN